MLKARETHSWKRLLPNQSASFLPLRTNKNKQKKSIFNFNLLLVKTSYVTIIDDKVIDVQYRPLCSPKLKNSFLTPVHDKLTILASCLHLLSFLAPNPPKKRQVIYGWPCFEIIMACYSLLFPLIYLLRRRMHESR